MEQISDELHDILLEDVKKNPELIAQLLFKDEDVSLILEKHGDIVRFAYLRTYDKETTNILEEAKQEYKQKKKKGYNHEQAFNDLTSVRDKINKNI